MHSFLNGRLIQGAVILTFIFVALFSPLSIVGMEHHQERSVNTCPFMNSKVVLCQMDVFEHLALWQTMFSMLPGVVTAIVFLGVSVLLARWFIGDPPNRLEVRPFLPTAHHIPFILFFLGTVRCPRAP